MNCQLIAQFMTISLDNSVLKKQKNQKQPTQICHSLLSAKVVGEVDSRGDAADDNGNPPTQEVET